MQRGYISELFVSFQGEGLHVGRRHLFIRFAGCNLRCRYCDTPDSLERVDVYRIQQSDGSNREGVNPVSVEELVQLADGLIREHGYVDGVAFTGGEPLLQSDFIARVVDDLRIPRPRLLETNGMLPEKLADVLPAIDSVSMDIKIPSNSGEGDLWDEHARFLTVARGKVYVKVLVDDTTRREEVRRAGRLVAEYAPETSVYLQPITSVDSRVHVSAQTLSCLYSELRQWVADVRVLPQTHKMLGIR